MMQLPEDDTLDRAEELLDDDRVEEALKLVRGLYGHALPSSSRGRALAIEAVCLDLLDRPDEADELINAQMADEHEDLGYILSAGMEFSDLESYARAEVFLQNLSELDPTNPLPWHNLAITLAREERFPEAIKSYERVIALDPNFADVYLQKGFCHGLMLEWDKARALYRHYLTLEPRDADGWLALADVESQCRLRDAAYEAYAKAAEFHSAPEEVYHKWAATASRLKDFEQLERCMEKLGEIDSEAWRYLMVKAEHEVAQGDVWAAWEAMSDGFDCALDDEDDDDALELAATTFLAFVRHHDMQEHAEPLIGRLFAAELFSDETLTILRLIYGRYSNESRNYQVVVHASAEDDQGEEYRVLGVTADSEEEAGDLATWFENRRRGARWRVYSAQALTNPDEGSIGVYWRSHAFSEPPGRSGREVNEGRVS